MNSDVKHELIELALPINAAFVSAARLTASSIANRMGFDIEAAEDIKAAVSESCIYFIKIFENNSSIIEEDEENSNSFKISFLMDENELIIKIISNFKANKALVVDPDNIALIMIKALMNHVEISVNENAQFVLHMLKKLEQNSLTL